MKRPLSHSFPFILAVAVACIAMACRPRVISPEEFRNDAATFLTGRYADSRIAHWRVRARTAGPECTVLHLHLAIPADDATIESLHYGSGPYDVVPGGINRYFRDNAFLGVAYEDQNERIWTYGGISRKDFRSMDRCSEGWS